MPSGRFVRNLALSLSGGALLTLLGAGIAQANEAGTASDGQGTAGTGDASAVGNRSGTSASQGQGISGGGGQVQVINQNAGVANVGVAVANTGGNVATGNSAISIANAGQIADGNPRPTPGRPPPTASTARSRRSPPAVPSRSRPPSASC